MGSITLKYISVNYINLFNFMKQYLNQLTGSYMRATLALNGLRIPLYSKTSYDIDIRFKTMFVRFVHLEKKNAAAQCNV